MDIHFSKIILFIIGCLVGQFVLGQTISVTTQKYSQDNGFYFTPKYIHKDSRGLIWIGSETGLFRFDGQGFEQFGENIGLPFLRIDEVFEDSEGWFWLYKNCKNQSYDDQISCDKNLAFFHPLTKEVLTFEQRFNQASVKPNQIEGIFRDSIRIYFTADQKLLNWSLEAGLQAVQIKGLSKTPYLFTKINDRILGAVYIESKDTFSLNPQLDDIGKQDLQYVAIDLDGKLVQSPKAFSIPGLRILQLKNIGKEAFHFDRLWIKNLEISFSPNGSLYIDTLAFEVNSYPKIALPGLVFDERLYKNDQGANFHAEIGAISSPEAIYPIKSNPNKIIHHSLVRTVWLNRDQEADTDLAFQQLVVGNSSAHHIFDTLTNTVWRARGQNITTYRYQQVHFHHAFNPKLKGGGMGALNLDDENVILITGYYSTLYTRKDGVHSYQQILKSLPEPYMPKSYCTEPEDSEIWATDDDQIYLLKINKADFSYTRSRLPYGDAKLLLKDGNILWFGRNKGIQYYDIDQDFFAEFTQYNEFESLKSSVVHFIQKKDSSHYWICSDSGLYLFSKERGIIARYGNTEAKDFYLPASDFHHISKSASGGYWLATMNGLIHLVVDGPQFKIQRFLNFDKKKGFSSDKIYAAYEDDFGFVWMPTPSGLIQFQISSELSTTYLKEDGLSNSTFKPYAHTISADGTLYFGAFGGFNIFHPRHFRDVELMPKIPLIITDFEQHKDESDRIEYRLVEVLRDNEIVIQPGDKFFNVRVALADYRDAEKHQFSYKIEGYQKDWQEDKSNLIRISGLPYGQYVLQIRGRLHNGLIAQPGLEIPIRVLKPFYLQTWFFVLSGFVVLLAVLFYNHQRARKYKERQKELEAEVAKATQTIRQQNEELKNLDKVKSRFFANVSHELRTPVTLILGPLNSIIKSGSLNQKNQTFAELSRKSAKNLLNLVNEILDLTKMESGKIELEEEPVGFYSLLQLLTSAFDGMAQQKNIQYRFEYLADKELWLELDAKKFEKILNNLLSNAFKFTPPYGQIIVRAAERESRILLSVEDSGRGIHPKDLPHVFDRFYQSSQPDAQKEGGTGIGLSLCMEFAKLMGGQLVAKSTLGKGSIFEFEFPKKATQRIVEAEQDRLATEISPDSVLLAEEVAIMTPIIERSGPARILLVEDNDNLRDFIRLIVEEKYEVTTAENGRVAWDYLTVDCGRLTVDGERSEKTDRPPSTDNPKGASRQPQRGKPTTDNRPPDLIISDIMMPEMDGYELLEKLKSSDQYRGIPVIMLTALAELKDKLKALRIGVDDYMVKPFAQEELLARIENLLNNYYSRNQWQREFLEEKPEEPVDKPAISVEDTIWLEEVESILKRELSNSQFSVRDLAHEIAISERQLERRLKRFIGLTPKKYFLEIQLQEAKRLFETKRYRTISQVAYASGFSNPKHFSTVFRKHFGVPPSQFFAQQ